LKQTGIRLDTAFFGPEAEFFIFDDIRYDTNERSITIFWIHRKEMELRAVMRTRILGTNRDSRKATSRFLRQIR